MPLCKRMDLKTPVWALAVAVLLGPVSGGVSAQTLKPTPIGELTDIEREIWTDPDFKRRFVESYLSETDLEPTLALADRELLVRVFEVLDTEDYEADAKEKIERVNKDKNLSARDKAQKIAEINEEADQAVQARAQRREELEIRLDIDGDGQDEPEIEVALYEVETYIKGLKAGSKPSPTLHFFNANFRMQMALNLPAPEIEAPRREGFEQAEAYEKARAQYDGAVQAHERAVRARLLQAADDYEKAVQGHEKFRRAWRNLGLLRVRLKQYDEARGALGRVIELGGGDSDTFGLLGYCFSQMGQHLPAESAYRMANMLNPTENNWQMGLVSSFFFQKRYADVAALTGEMIKADPGNAELWMLQANAFIGLQQPMRAAENYEVVDGLGGSTVQSLSMLANIYTNEGLHETAVGAYLKALEKADGAEQARSLADQLLLGAKVLASQGAIEPTKRMIAEVDQAVGGQLSGEQRKGWLKLKARIAVQEGASGQEVAVLEEIVKLDPMDGEAIILLGQNAMRQGDREQAIFYFQRAGMIEEHEVDAKIQEARVWVKQGDYNKALVLLRAAQQIQPKESVQRFIDDLEKASRSS